MRISQAEKEQTYRRIVKAAVDLISENGFKSVSMRSIAQGAEVGDATVYRYFRNKEAILYAYFELAMEELVEQLKAVDDFHELTFREQFHTVLETHFELLEEDRAFVRIAYRNFFLTNWISAATASRACKMRFIEIVNDLIDAAVEVGEFHEPPMRQIIGEALWEYLVGVTYYWLNDESPNHQATTQLVDKGLALIEASLQSEVWIRAVELVQYLIREHLLSKLQPMERPHRHAPAGKRRFMAAVEGAR